MESLDKEIKELKVFIADLKEDRAAQKEKEKRESWTKYVSVSIVFIAVLAAVATQRAGKYSSQTLVALNDATYNQALASDQWSYFQANSIKQNLYEGLRDSSVKDLGVSGNATNHTDVFADKIKKYAAAKDEIKKKAESLEADRDKARTTAAESSKRGGAMGLAVSIFQISIAMGSICLVTKKKWLWHVALLLALGATVQMAMAWLR